MNETKILAQLISNISKDSWPVLNYTLDEIKEYAYSSNIPEEMSADIVNAVDFYAEVALPGISTYVEIQTKDGYTFKGTIVNLDENYQDVSRAKLTYSKCVGSKWELVSLIIAINMDDETGDRHYTLDNIVTNYNWTDPE